jgi:hypothetical protein
MYFVSRFLENVVPLNPFLLTLALSKKEPRLG